MDSADVDEAVTEMVRVLRDQEHWDWTVAAGRLEWSCRDTAVHVVGDLVTYAAQLAAAPEKEYLPFDIIVDDDTGSDEILRMAVHAGQLLVLALRSAPPGALAFHPYGTSDASGFAAMAVAEVLVHTWDVTRGLGVSWEPPETVSQRVVDRLFPGSPAGDPGAVLLWCTGRRDLAGSAAPYPWRWDSSVR